MNKQNSQRVSITDSEDLDNISHVEQHDSDQVEYEQSQYEQYFLFISNQDIYAIEALEVIEIVEYLSITKVPMMQPFVEGVTNIRGNIIAVIDLLQRFNLGKTKVTDKTSLAILRKKHQDKLHQIAIIIDEVYEVENISIDNIEPTPDFGTRVDKAFIKSMIKYNDEYIPILNIDSLLDISELSALSVRDIT